MKVKTKIITQKDIDAGIKRLKRKKVPVLGCSEAPAYAPPCELVQFSAKKRVKELYNTLPYLIVLFETGDATEVFNKLVDNDYWSEEVPLSEAEVMMCRLMFNVDKFNISSSFNVSVYRNIQNPNREILNIEGLRPYYKFDITLILKK